MRDQPKNIQPDRHSRRPRIGVDLHVVDGIFQGSRTHCLELFSHVVEITPECDFFLFLDRPAQLVEFSSAFALPHVRIVRMPHASAAWRLLHQLPSLGRRHQLDLLHTQYIAPPFSPCPTAITVHDILFESHPHFFDRLFVVRSRLLVRSSVRRSVEVFTVSKFSRDQMAATYGVAPDRIHTIFNGVDRSRFSPGEQGSETVRAAGLIPGRYFLTVGRIEPRKNHAGLLQAWAGLPAPRPRLVVAGQKHFGNHDVLHLAARLGISRDVTFLDNISDQHLPAFFRHSRGFVYCSWAEGFGMPVLEAMASGVPVVSSGNTALSEICGDAALLVDPADTNAMRDAIAAVNSQTDLRCRLILRGLDRASAFTWTKSAETLRRVYLRRAGVPEATLLHS